MDAILDPALISRIGNLQLRARLVVEGFLAGLHRSPYHGFSAEFRDHRSYQPTDPPRLVDWRLLGRSDRVYVKQYTDETNLRAYILLDTSTSMAYQDRGPLSKIDYAKALAASISLLLLRQRDAVGAGIFDEQLRQWIRPSTFSGQFERLLTAFSQAPTSGGTKPLDVFIQISGLLPPRGLVILISDLLVPSKELTRALRLLASGKHELLVIRVLDRSERLLPEGRIMTLEDMETGQRMTIRPPLIREAYSDAVHRAWRELEDGIGRFRAHLVDIDTSEDLSLSLAATLHARARMK